MRKILLKDSTLREGLDVPGVRFSLRQKLTIARLLHDAGVPEIEVVAPAKVFDDLAFLKKLNKTGSHPKTSGLVYAHKPGCRDEIEALSVHIDRIDVLMPVSCQRKPYSKKTKISLLLDILDFASRFSFEVGAGFPHSFQTDLGFLSKISCQAIKHGAGRITIYDTNGGADPFTVYQTISRLKKQLRVPILFHAHNDLGLATANCLAAVCAGADALDVTVNGLGDRAGNAALEQAAMILRLKKFETGIRLQSLRRLAEAVEKMSGVRRSKLAPIVGEYIYAHMSPAHLENPGLFLAFDPRIMSPGIKRKGHGDSRR